MTTSADEDLTNGVLSAAKLDSIRALPHRPGRQARRGAPESVLLTRPFPANEAPTGSGHLYPPLRIMRNACHHVYRSTGLDHCIDDRGG